MTQAFCRGSIDKLITFLCFSAEQMMIGQTESTHDNPEIFILQANATSFRKTFKFRILQQATQNDR